MTKSIYIHIPFCEQICSYCDFCKVFYQKKLVHPYLESLSNEIEEIYRGEKIKTLYIGGGTPSALTLEELTYLFEIIEIISIAEDLEFTFECNIENLNKEKLEFLYQKGVNRLSIGVQTMQESFLSLLNRNHTISEVKEKISLAKQVGFKNINIDFMYAFPKEDIKDVKNDIQSFLELDVPHISIYSLILEPHTKLYIENVKEIDEDIERDMFDTIHETLTHSKYTHYELSNFSKKGYASKHNTVYWDNNHYYGFGAGASGYIGEVRYDNTRSISSYISGKRRVCEQKQSKKQKLENEFILGFRKRKGISKQKFYDKYQFHMMKILVIQKLIEEKKLIENKTHVFINPIYIYIMNEILIDFINREEGCYEYDNV